ncbi:hypothetical protein [Flavobacterium sp. HJSW_4]|uniref:hypothetical protein n=1 Tax=Flavobacterium sp. HJSW_4 TaxID=3344660 RepID=UPI0035F4627F
MTEIKIIFRFNISEVAYPSVEEILYSEKELNIISGNRIKNDFLKSENTIANKINSCIENGELIPAELWYPFCISMISEGKTNVFAAGIGDLKEFEECLETNNFRLSEIIYLKLNDISKITQMAKVKYPKMYDDEEILKNDIERYNKMREEIINYALPKYKVVIEDFFSKQIKL